MVKGKQQAGFTLLEVVVALAVLGLLLVGLTQGTRYGLMAWQRQADTVATREELDAVDRTVRQLLANAIIQKSENPDELAFTGDLPAAVALVTRRADMILHVDAGHRLVLRWMPHLHETALGPPATPTDTPLLNDVERLEVAYWHGEDANGPAGWTDTIEGAALPKIVKLTIVFPNRDRRHWPAIIAEPLSGRQNG
jgi:general secretion pathway protein J